MLAKRAKTSRIGLIVGGVALPAFVAIQFVRPAISGPPPSADLATPPAVKQIRRNSCYNCHSNEARLAWFDRIATAYWLVARICSLSGRP